MQDKEQSQALLPYSLAFITGLIWTLVNDLKTHPKATSAVAILILARLSLKLYGFRHQIPRSESTFLECEFFDSIFWSNVRLIQFLDCNSTDLHRFQGLQTAV